MKLCDFDTWSLYTPSPRGMRRKSVTCVGLADGAAHFSDPAGQGVNIAIADALKLASL